MVVIVTDDFEKELDKKIKMYEECNIKHDKAHLFIEYIKEILRIFVS